VATSIRKSWQLLRRQAAVAAVGIVRLRTQTMEFFCINPYRRLIFQFLVIPRGWSLSPDQVKVFQFSMSWGLALGPTQPSILMVLGALSPEVKQQGCEADYFPTSAEVNKARACISTPPHTSSWRSA
jgi:hypothetical protein